MTYFLALSGLMALIGLTIAAAATTGPFTAFGFALFAFGVLFGFFLIKRHFDEKDAAQH
ncbi:hypothetical protein [Falsiroseomonas sp. CW058]|uniref:hypothetical protein n=1 Tax=Falsiroseomonas sp. CW058 TaxID=3388664 RepID=UPI003D322DE9